MLLSQIILLNLLMLRQNDIQLKFPITIKGFLIRLNKILKDSKVEKNEIIRHDLKTQTLMSIANKFNESKQVEWTSYNEYKNI